MAEPSSTRDRARDAVAYLVLGGFLTALQVVMLELRGAVPIALAFGFNTLVGVLIGSIIDLGQRLSARVFDIENRAVAVRLIAVILTSVVAIVVGVEIAIRLLHGLVPGTGDTWSRTGVLWVAVPVTVVMVAIGRERERMRTRAVRAERDAEAGKRHALRAELDALRSRTNPHFLFNALNTIAALIAEDPARAEDAVERLAGLLRHALEGSRQSLVSLGAELAATLDYVEFERLRFGDRLQLHVRVPESLRDAFVPPMSLQPLVENAVLHGVAARRRPTTITVWARCEGNTFELGVDDDGSGDGDHVGSGTALADLRARLKLVMGDDADLATERRDAGFNVVMRWPLHDRAKGVD